MIQELLHRFESGGIYMWPILACALVVIAITVDRVYYLYVVVNEDLQRAEADLAAVVRAERLRHMERQKMTQHLLAGGVLG